MRVHLGSVGGGTLVLVLVLAGCATQGRPDARLDPAAAAALADSFRAALGARFEPPVHVRYGKFAEPSSRDSIPGYVVRISAPYEMVGGDTLPHEWLRTRLGAGGWMVEAEARTPDDAWFRAVSGRAAVTVVAAWEDLHDPAEEPDWYSVTLGIPSRAKPR